MTASSIWRKLAVKFREIPDLQALLRADWISIDGNEGFQIAGDATAEIYEPFESLANIAGLELGGIGTTDPLLCWLDALKREGGVSNYSQTIMTATDSTGRKEEHETGSILHLCSASAEVCDSLERKALQMETLLSPIERFSPPAKEQALAPGIREKRLQDFIAVNRTTVAAVCRAAKVAKANMQQWRHAELSSNSVMSERIENVLNGKRPLHT
jgi:hypothetical protein